MLLAIAIAYVVALLLPWDLGPWPALFALSLALLFLGYGAGLRARLWAVPLALAVFLAGLEKPEERIPVDPPPGLHRVDGVVRGLRHDAEGVRADVEVRRAEAVGEGEGFANVPLRVRGLDLPPGTRALFVARVSAPNHVVNPPAPGVIELDRRLPTAAKLVGAPRVLEPASALSRALHALRGRIREGLVSTLSPEAAGVARALVLGEGGAVDREAHAAIRDAGLSHVLAVSGLHVGIVGGGLFALVSAVLARLGTFLDPARAAAALSILPTVGFSFVAGGSPSAIRAGTMLALALFCRAMNRRPRPLATLGGAMMIFALTTPSELGRPAFLLSVLATLAILTMPRAKSRAWKALEVSWQLSYRTTIATAPAILLYFRTIPLSGLVSNLVLVPMASVGLIPLALLQGALGLLGAGELTAPLLEHAVAAFTLAAKAFASLGLDLTPPPITAAQLVAVSLGAVIALGSLAWRKKLAVLAVLLLVWAGDEARLRLLPRFDDHLRVTVLDVGQGSAAVVELPRRAGVIVADAGPDKPDAGARVLVPFLEARRIGAIDLFLASHAHPDHVGGLGSLHEAIPIRELWAPREGEGSFARALAAMRGSTRVRFTSVDGCTAARFGEVRVEALAPCPGDPLYLHENDDSLVVKITHGVHAVLLPGDVEARREAMLRATRAEALRATLLVAPHHGSRTSSTDALLDAVAPEVVFVSAGRRSRFGHPHREPMERYQERNARTWVTSRHGGLVFVTDGARYAVEASASDAGLEHGGEDRE